MSVNPDATDTEMKSSKTEPQLSVNPTLVRRNSAKQTMFENVQILDQELSKYSTFNELEKKTGVPKVYLGSVFLLFLMLLLVFGFGAKILGHIVSLVWPAYRSYVVIDALEKLVKLKDGTQEPIHVYGRSKFDQRAELEIYQKIRNQLTMDPIKQSLEDLGSQIEDFLADQKEILMDRCHEKTKKYLMYWVVYGVLYLSEYVFNVLMWWIPFYWTIKLVFLFWCVSPKWQGAVYVYHNIFAPFLRNRKPFIESWILTVRSMIETTFTELKDDGATLVATPFDAEKIIDVGKTFIDQVNTEKIMGAGTMLIKRARKLTATAMYENNDEGSIERKQMSDTAIPENKQEVGTTEGDTSTPE